MRSGSDFAPPVRDATDAILPAALSRAKLLRVTFHTLRRSCGSGNDRERRSDHKKCSSGSATLISPLRFWCTLTF